MKPDISVVIPSHNRASLIGATLDCMLRQSLPPKEIIVVDNGSTDDTCAEVERFGPRVTLIRQENLGPGAGRNAGFSRASGAFVQFFDSDDLATLDLLEAKFNVITETGVDLVYGPWLPVRIDGANCFHDGVTRQAEPVSYPPLSAFLRGWIVLLPSCLIRRETILRFGGYPTQFRTAEDSILLFDMLAGGVRMAFTPKSIVLVRQHPHGQVSRSPEAAALRAIEYLQFATTVRNRLSQESLPVTWLDRLWWRVNFIQSAEHLATFTPAAHPIGKSVTVPASALERQLVHILIRLRQLNAGMRARVFGSRLPPSYRTAPVNAYHETAIRELGFVPRRTHDIFAVADGSEAS